MHPLLERHRATIAEICRRFGVARLDVFGSAARAADFDAEVSDVDFLVEFAESKTPQIDAFFELQSALSKLLERKVDLVMQGSVRNPYVRESIERAREPVYGA
jgi:predicted nucleotidyltransferase